MKRLDKIKIDLSEYKIHLRFQNGVDPLVIHFDTPSRRFYFALIALVAIETKKLQKPGFVYIRKHENTLMAMDRSLAGSYASTRIEDMWGKIRKAWRNKLPDLEGAASFKILNRKLTPPFEQGGKYRYACSEDESDIWANLFQYDANNTWRFKFGFDSVFLGLDDVQVTLDDKEGRPAWEKFLENYKPVEKIHKNELGIGDKRKPKYRYQKPAAVAALLAIFIAGLAVWNFFHGQLPPASVDKMAYPLPDKPSIAVLPFDNLSGDPEQEYLSDGITENIITALSKIHDMFVIARNSTFTYKGKPTKAKQVAEELGVRYVLEGSVQKSGERLRITGQLIDAIKGHHIWAESYDRKLKDIFVLQDEITIKIISAIDKKLLRGGELRVYNYSSDTKSLQAYLKIMEARHHLVLATPGDNALARKLSEEAISLDPEYPRPYDVLSWTHIMDVRLGKSKSPRDSINKAFELAQKLMTMDSSNPGAHSMMGNVYLIKREYEKAIAEFERAVALDPNWAKGFMWLAESLTTTGRPQEAIPLLKKSMRLSPLSQRHASMCLWRLGRAYYAIGQYEQTLPALKKAIDIRPNMVVIRLDLVATYIHLGREEEAHAAAAEVLRINPKFSLERFAKRNEAYKDQSLQDRYIGALRKAGLK